MFIIKTRFLHFATLNCKHGAVISKICKWLNSVNTKETSLEYFSNHRENKYQFGFNGSYITSTTTGQARNTIQPSLIILYARFILNDLSLDMYFELTSPPAWFNFVFCHVLQFNSLQYPTIQFTNIHSRFRLIELSELGTRETMERLRHPSSRKMPSRSCELC